MNFQALNKLFLSGLISLLVNVGFAQNDTLQLLKGEWYYFGLIQPEVNDTSRLSREKNYDSYIKWEFRENGSLTKQIVTEMTESGDSDKPAFILGSNLSSNWLYDKEKKTIELRDFSKLYKITGINKNFLELVRIK